MKRYFPSNSATHVAGRTVPDQMEKLPRSQRPNVGTSAEPHCSRRHDPRVQQCRNQQAQETQSRGAKTNTHPTAGRGEER